MISEQQGVPDQQPPAAAAAAEPAAAAQAAMPPGDHATNGTRKRSPSPAAAVAAPPVKQGGRGRGRGRRGGRGGRGAAAAAAAQPQELVKLGPEIARGSERLRTGWRPVQLSSEDRAGEIELDERQLAAASEAGYRMVRATHGTHSGTWYYEVRIDRLGPSGAARVGWATRQAELQAPVGADEHGFGYRSQGGSKVHKGWRDDYGQPYGEGDVIGCLLHLPEGGRPFEKGPADVVRHKGKLYFTEDAAPAQPQPLPGSFVAFTLNGTLQGKAYEGLREGTYYPALSMFTDRRQQQTSAAVTVNFGDSPFAFPPPSIEGCPQPRPVCELPGPRPQPARQEAAAAAQAQQAAAQQQQQAQQAQPPPQQQTDPTPLGGGQVAAVAEGAPVAMQAG